MAIGLALIATRVSAQQLATPNVEKTEANIAKITSAFLQQQHFSHHPFDQEIAGKFLDRYLDMLDGFHIYFLQSDLDEFDSFRTNLNILTMSGNVSPAQFIFNRFMQRVDQRQEYISGLMKTEDFTFDGHDRFIFDRHKLAHPKDLAEAKEIWRQELRYEYLSEKLNAPDIKYAGPAQLDSKGTIVIKLTRDKEHPLKYDFLPKKFYADGGREIGSLELQSESNAVIRLEQKQIKELVKFDQKLYDNKSVEIGKVGCRWQTNEVEQPGALDPLAKPLTTNEYVGVIQLNEKNLTEINKTLTNRYAKMVKNYKDLDRDDVFELYMTSLAHAYDPHSDYMGHSQFENFNIQLQLSLFGIGAVLRSEDGYCKIESLTEGPASKSGKIKPGDRIVAVAQGDKEPVDVVGMKLTKVVEQVRGPKGTVVRLTLIPAGSSDSSARKVVTLVRDEVKVEDAEAKAKLFEMPTQDGRKARIGVVDLPSFYHNDGKNKLEPKSMTVDVARLIARLKAEHVDGIILDLRNNGGGFLEEAIALTGLFIKKGPVVQTKEPTGEVVVDSDNDPSLLYDGPLVVLTSRFSASASEIVAGALQDYGRALIIGDKSTFGKGTVQAPEPLAPYLDQRKWEHVYDPGVLKLTIRKFYRAGGSSTQLEGVIPDIELPSIRSYLDVSERSMENALQWDTVSSADFEKLNRVKPYLAELQKRSAQRLQTDKDFSYVKEDIEEYKKTLEDKSVSLNEKERLAEKKKTEARLEDRKKERASRPKSDEKVYEITLKNIGLAELQPPVVKTNGVAAAARLEMPELNDEEAAVDPKMPDATLDEARRILEDYAIALAKQAAITAK